MEGPLSAAHPLLESAMAGLERRIFLGQLAPLGSGAQHPEHAIEHSTRVVPRSSPIVGPPRWPQNLHDLIGVNLVMEKRINSHGIMSVEQLCQLTPQQMRRVWGSVLGERMWHWLRGADFNDPESERKSLGHQHVLGPE
jgi:DNA polymerase-4